MRKSVKALLIAAGCIAILCVSLSGCNSKYKRIRCENSCDCESDMSYITDHTAVVNNANASFPSQIPIYEIKERTISERDCQLMLDALALRDKQHRFFELEGNLLHISLASYANHDRGYFEMSEEEGEKLAWKVFHKIPFMEGEYECVGIRDTYELWDNEGSHITRAGFVFCRLLDGVRVVGSEDCALYFDGSGLVEIYIRLFDYDKIGTMNMIPLAEAEARLKTPDNFNVEASGSQGKLETLQVDQVKLRLVNQYYKGCTILQPIYYFTGTAAFQNDYEADFSSTVIAIPESYTYEEE